MSEIADMLRDVPPRLAAAWGGWLVMGLLLVLWHLRARDRERAGALARAMANARTKSSVRPLSGVRTAAPKPVVLDAFEELEALLDPPPAKGVSRRPD